MSSFIGVGLAGGQGIRCRPLTLQANDYVRAKAVVPFLGRPILSWLVDMLKGQGMSELMLVTIGRENRSQIKSLLGYGDDAGIPARYSPIQFDRDNTGSADALLSNLEYFELTDPDVLVFPTDSILEADLEAMRAFHRRSNAVVTIATAALPVERIAGRYGLVRHDATGRVQGFVEKPALSQICAMHGGANPAQLPPLMTNAGFYMVDAKFLRKIIRHPALSSRRLLQFDIGGDLLPWLVAHGYPVYSHQIAAMGDLGNIPSYLETMNEVLEDRYPAMTALLGGKDAQGIYIDPTSLEMTDPLSKLTLREKIEHRMVTLVGPVRIGKYVTVCPGAALAGCNIDDECEIREHAAVVRSSVGAASYIGAYSRLQGAVTGEMVRLHSSQQAPVFLKRTTALGDEVEVGGGAMLIGEVSVYPRVQIPAGTYLHGPCTVESTEQLTAVPAMPVTPPLAPAPAFWRTAGTATVGA